MLKAVVMDNNALSRDLLKSLLTSGGHEIIGDANISPPGVARAIKFGPQIICIDLGQDLEVGRAILGELRTALPKTLLFSVSAEMRPDHVKMAMEQGVHGFIVKPFNAGTVLASIRNAVIKLVRSQQSKADAIPPPDDATSS